ncbi:MAG: helix-turn-helix domain-containing protein [Chloroflexota bacterium]|nr:helix-turn-helix domain-containing protein [Chloroflexota bacterium]
MEEPQNPYFWMPGTFNLRQFYGAPKWVRLILEQITFTPPHDLELIGLPGMAKTTLLRYIADPQGALHDYPDWLQAPYDQQADRLFMALVQFRLAPADTHPFIYLYHRFYEEYALYCDRQLKHDPALRRVYPLLPSPDKQTATTAVDTMQLAIERLVADDIRPVLLLDDFDLAFARLDLEQTTRLRPWRDRVAFVLVTERPLHEVNAKAAGSPFFQTMPVQTITGLPPAEARRMLAEPAQNAGCPFPDADVDTILPYTGGHPYLLILAGRALWETRARLTLLGSVQPLSAQQQQMLRGRLQDNFGRTFQFYRDGLSPAELQALRLLINEGTGTDYATLAALEAKGLVQYEAADNYVPFSPLFAEFVAGASASPVAPADLPLTGIEGQFYDYLYHNADRVCLFDELAREVWHAADPNDADIRRRMQVTVSRLRKKLKTTTGDDISSVRDQGYRLLPRAVT